MGVFPIALITPIIPITPMHPQPRPIPPGLSQRDHLKMALFVLLAQCLLASGVRRNERRRGRRIQQRADHGGGTRGITDMHDRSGIGRGNLDGRMNLRSRRAAYQQRQPHPKPLHLGRQVRHFVQRRRD